MAAPYRYHVLPCSGPYCGAEAGERLRARFKELCPDRKALGVRISSSSCQGMCDLGPNVLIYPEGTAYHGIREGDLERIVEQHLRGGKAVAELQDPARGSGEKSRRRAAEKPSSG